MPSCKACNGTNFVTENDQSVCHDCGNITESMYLVSDSNALLSSFVHYGDPTDSVAYRNFKELYESCTRTLNTPRKIADEGIHMLPSLWKIIRQRRIKTKRLFLVAMLYLLYRQHDMPIVFTQFLKYAHVPKEKLHRIAQLVMKQFGLPMFRSMNRSDITANSISELVKLVFKESRSTDMERETEKLAQRVANVIYKEGWADPNSKHYISLVSIVSTILSAQYVCSNETSRKTKGGRKSCFRFKTLNYEKMADHMCVHVMAVKKCLKCIQEQLYKVVELLPWLTAVVKRTIDVGRVLVDVLDYIGIDVIEETVVEEGPPMIPRPVKEVLLAAILDYVTANHDVMVNDRPLINMEKFRIVLDKRWRENNIDLVGERSTMKNNMDLVGERSTMENNMDLVGERSTMESHNISQIERSKDSSKTIDNESLNNKEQLSISNSEVNSERPTDHSSKSGTENGIKSETNPNPVYNKDHILVGDYVIKFEYLELYKDLLLSGCEIRQLLDDDYISLVEKYVDMQDAADEHEMEEFTEEEMSLFFKDPSEFVSSEEKKRTKNEPVDKIKCTSDIIKETGEKRAKCELDKSSSNQGVTDPEVKRLKIDCSREGNKTLKKGALEIKASLGRLSSTIDKHVSRLTPEDVDRSSPIDDVEQIIQVKEEFNSSSSSIEN